MTAKMLNDIVHMNTLVPWPPIIPSWCLPNSPKPDSPKLGLGSGLLALAFRVRYRVKVTIDVSANRD